MDVYYVLYFVLNWIFQYRFVWDTHTCLELALSPKQIEFLRVISNGQNRIINKLYKLNNFKRKKRIRTSCIIPTGLSKTKKKKISVVDPFRIVYKVMLKVETYKLEWGNVFNSRFFFLFLFLLLLLQKWLYKLDCRLYRKIILTIFFFLHLYNPS